MVLETELTAVAAGGCATRTSSAMRARSRPTPCARHRPPAPRRAALALGDAYAVGDCVAPRLLADCIFDGHRLAMEIEEPDPMVPARVRREPRVIAGFS